MRCYFMRGGRIEAVEELAGFSDERGLAKAHALFSERKHKFEGFELWNRTRVIVRHPERQITSLSGRFIGACREPSRRFARLICLARRRSRHKSGIPRG
jgi:hypothetical protein